jgi:hypothetical protein
MMDFKPEYIRTNLLDRLLLAGLKNSLELVQTFAGANQSPFQHHAMPTFVTNKRSTMND